MNDPIICHDDLTLTMALQMYPKGYVHTGSSKQWRHVECFERQDPGYMRWAFRIGLVVYPKPAWDAFRTCSICGGDPYTHKSPLIRS